MRCWASLPWYDIPELRESHDAFWSVASAELRRVGFDAPTILNRDVSYEEMWRSPDLLLSQACGYDVVTDSRSLLQVVATPSFMLPGCETGTYASEILLHVSNPARSVEDLRDARCVVNSPTSHSGTNSLRSVFAPLARDGRFFSSVSVSGAHVESLAMLRTGAADVAAIDRVLLALLRRHRPEALEGLRTWACTVRAPAPPFVTARRRSPEEVRLIRHALEQTFTHPASRRAAAELLIGGLCPSTVDYRRLLIPQEVAGSSGYRDFEALGRGEPPLRRG